ncbi:MAG: bifunctional pyr operon transcriptional regulator/uracil phosphoribosyltransferase PyrR [Pseudanabaenaceae cyanobacterium bins.68]|nr:bifunctional pyr operon transcriptional regulator/uracil phosphoribosyltransferase PyrR [Pseudanabaenaceae cyanobacterium bins.68]
MPPLMIPTVVEIYSAEELRRTVNRLASEIVENAGDLANLVLVGIRTRGVPLSELIAQQIEILEQIKISQGALDVTLFRDDLDRIGLRVPGQTNIPVDLTGKLVVLIDDVLFSGRTVGAALNALNSYGRPAAIRLAVLIDRGHRELPIHPDYVGKVLPTAKGEQVKVFLRAVDGQDGVNLLKPYG